MPVLIDDINMHKYKHMALNKGIITIIATTTYYEFQMSARTKKFLCFVGKKNDIVKNGILLKLSLKILMKKNFGGIFLGFAFVINKTK